MLRSLSVTIIRELERVKLIMSEIDIFTQIQSGYDRLWVVLQFWGGVTLGLVAVAYFAAKRLNVFLLTFLLIVYILFSAFAHQSIVGVLELIYALVTDLQNLKSSGVALTLGSLSIIESSSAGNINSILGFASIYGTFVGAVAYVVYSYWINRDNS